jgi:hypothetical protein
VPCGTHRSATIREAVVSTMRVAPLHPADPQIKQARREYLKSLTDVLVFLLRDMRLWRGLKEATKKQKSDRSLEQMGTPLDLLLLLDWCRALRFRNKPDDPFACRTFLCANPQHDCLDHLNGCESTPVNSFSLCLMPCAGPFACSPFRSKPPLLVCVTTVVHVSALLHTSP